LPFCLAFLQGKISHDIYKQKQQNYKVQQKISIASYLTGTKKQTVKTLQKLQFFLHSKSGMIVTCPVDGLDYKFIGLPIKYGAEF